MIFEDKYKTEDPVAQSILIVKTTDLSGLSERFRSNFSETVFLMTYKIKLTIIKIWGMSLTFMMKKNVNKGPEEVKPM